MTRNFGIDRAVSIDSWIDLNDKLMLMFGY
jgi:hypothetical protein